MSAYSLLSSVATCEGRSAPCYGIKGGGFEIHDVSFDKDFMQAQIDQFNTLGLAPEHMRDALDNLLVKQCG